MLSLFTPMTLLSLLAGLVPNQALIRENEFCIGLTEKVGL